VVSLAILIRPTNILLLFILIFLDITSANALWKRILLFLKPAYILTFIVIAILIFLPQLFYWKYLTGNFLYYSYKGEGFVNWKDPLMIQVWFSPLNGFFIYTPLALLFVAGIVIMIVKKIPNGIFIGLFFLLASYVFASWHCWYFGGSFGYRPMVEFFSILALPFGYFLSGLKVLKNLYIRSLLITFIFVASCYNLVLTYHQQWNPNSTWSWDDYLIHLDYSENYSPLDQQYTQRECVHSPGIAGYINEKVNINGKVTRRLDVVLHGPVKRIRATLWVNPGKKIRTKALLVCHIHDWNQKVYYYKQVQLDDFIKLPDTWTKVTGTFEIPEWIDQSNIMSIFVWNISKTSKTYIDDISLRFEKK
jgi:hypothetical protein